MEQIQIKMLIVSLNCTDILLKLCQLIKNLLKLLKFYLLVKDSNQSSKDILLFTHI